jgi:hypothetical protein
MTEQARRAVASYSTYQDAERAVDHLVDQGFPVQKVAIIGRDVRLVEPVIGRMGYGEAALQGAATGALPGVLVGWIFGLLNWLNPVGLDSRAGANTESASSRGRRPRSDPAPS